MIGELLSQFPEAGKWCVENVRLSAFPAEHVRPLDRIWKTITGDEPTSITEDPRQRILREDGPFESGRLICGAQPDRLPGRRHQEHRRHVERHLDGSGQDEERRDRPGWIRRAPAVAPRPEPIPLSVLIRTRNEADRIEATIRAAQAVDGPALIWFEIAEQQNILPMMPAGKGLSDLIETWGGPDE